MTQKAVNAMLMIAGVLIGALLPLTVLVGVLVMSFGLYGLVADLAIWPAWAMVIVVLLLMTLTRR